MPSPILARADALMHRKRQNDVDFDDVPVLTDAIGDDDDIPVLHEVEAPLPAAASSLPASETFMPETSAAPEISIAADESNWPDTPSLADLTLNAMLREQFASELARRVEQRLATELPRIIEATVRDFLAEQEMIAASSPHN